MQDLKQPNCRYYCHIGLGANLPSPIGTALETLTKALELFSGESLEIRRISKWYATPAFPAGSGPDFVNAVVLVETDLLPVKILTALHQIEATLGRTRENRWEPRICDLDLIDCDGLVLPDEMTFIDWQNMKFSDQTARTPTQLILPHPRLQDRAFVLVPMQDVSPEWVHPITGIGISKMIKMLPKADFAGITEISG